MTTVDPMPTDGVQFELLRTTVMLVYETIKLPFINANNDYCDKNPIS